jgi:hypothetical protein
VFSLFETKVQPIFEQINSLVILNVKLRQARDLLLPKLNVASSNLVSRSKQIKDLAKSAKSFYFYMGPPMGPLDFFDQTK